MPEAETLERGKRFALELAPWDRPLQLGDPALQKQLDELDQTARLAAATGSLSVLAGGAPRYGALARLCPTGPELLLRLAVVAYLGAYGWLHQSAAKKRAEGWEPGPALGWGVSMTTDEMNLCMDAIEQYRKVASDGVDLVLLEEELRSLYNWESCRKSALFVAKETPQKSGGCFVATAVYGTPTAREVQVLREYRDTILLHTCAGRAFVRVYQRLGPNLAEAISGRPIAVRLVRVLLLRPVLWFVRPAGLRKGGARRSWCPCQSTPVQGKS